MAASEGSADKKTVKPKCKNNKPTKPTKPTKPDVPAWARDMPNALSLSVRRGRQLKEIAVGMRDHFRDLVKSLTPEEKRALTDYSLMHFILLNSFLSQHDESQYMDITSLYTWSGLEEIDVVKVEDLTIRSIEFMFKSAEKNLRAYVGRMDGVFARAPRSVHPDLVVYRGIRGDLAETILNSTVGSVMEMHGYTSTSLDPSVSRRFINYIDDPSQAHENSLSDNDNARSNSNSNEGKKKKKSKNPGQSKKLKGVLLVVRIPAGTPFLFMDAVRKSTWEMELLLPRGARLKVLRRDRVDDIHAHDLLAYGGGKNTGVDAATQPKQSKQSKVSALVEWDELHTVYCELEGFAPQKNEATLRLERSPVLVSSWLYDPS